MSVFIVGHNDSVINNIEGYKNIFVGPNANELAEKYAAYTDSTGDNIASKNSNYSELTAQYWIWKNTNDHVKGIVHYRRLLTGSSTKYVLSQGEIEREINNGNVIVSSRVFVRGNLKTDYVRNHFQDDFDLAKNAIISEYPDYLDAFNQVMKRNYYHSLNILIAESTMFDSYTKWLFAILDDVERNSNYKNYDAYQGRIFGFLSERLLDVWLVHNQISVSERPVLFVGYNRIFKLKRATRQVSLRILGWFKWKQN